MKRGVRALAVVIVVLAAGACGRGGYLVVHVGASAAVNVIAAFHGTIVAGATQAEYTVRPVQPVDVPPEQTFAVAIPPSVAGLLQLHLDALDGTGAIIAAGDADADARDDRVTIVLGAVGPDGGTAIDAAGLDLSVGDLAEDDLPSPDLSATTTCPNIMLLVDASLSTSYQDAGIVPRTSEFGAMTQAIDATTAKYAARVPMGAVLFGLTGQMFQACSAGTLAPVEPAVGNATAISTLLASAKTNAAAGNPDVPLADLLSDAQFKGRKPSYAILITDDATACDPSTYPNASPTETNAAITAASQLRSAGYATYVISLPLLSINADALNQIALAGGGACTTCGGKAYYPAAAPDLVTNLTARLDQIIGAVSTGCP